jgi:two-component system, LytTR family, response regulator
LKLNCVIVDDEPLARKLIADYVQKVPSLHLVESCAGPVAAMDVLRSHKVDLMFLDVQMPELTGITLLKSLQKKPMVILTTAYSEYALQGYELDVVDYLLKPITFERFLMAVDKAGQRAAGTMPALPVERPVAAEPQQPFVFVKDGTKLVKVWLRDILFVEGLKDYVTIHTPTQKIVSLQRLKTLEAQLPAEKFIRIHNSYIVAVEAIDVVHKGEVQIGDKFLPIGETYRKTFKEAIDRNQM